MAKLAKQLNELFLLSLKITTSLRGLPNKTKTKAKKRESLN